MGQVPQEQRDRTGVPPETPKEDRGPAMPPMTPEQVRAFRHAWEGHDAPRDR